MAAERAIPPWRSWPTRSTPPCSGSSAAVCTAAGAHGVWVGVCGEAGGDAAATRSWSVWGSGAVGGTELVPGVKQAVRAVELATAMRRRERRATDDAAAVRR